MNTYPYSLILLLIVGCTQNKSNTTTSINNNSNSVTIKTNPISHWTKDTINIAYDDTLIFSKEELKQILQKHPELNSSWTKSPDLIYDESPKDINYNSEVGQDNYYALYAYFLKAKNGEKVYENQRKTLITLYKAINIIFQRLSHGGTYFGHQDTRILAYAEYSIYLLNEDKNYGNFKKSYSISKQKALYIATLKQMVDDEVSVDDDTFPNQKPKKKKELLKTVNEIDHLITNYFYLNMAQQYQYTNY